MPNWKKVILSGSNAALNDLTVNNLTVGGTFTGTTGDSDGDWREFTTYLSASKDVLITGSLKVSGSDITLTSGSLIVQAQHTDSTFLNEGIVFRSADISDNDNRIRVTTAENMQFNAAASFQFKPRDGHFVILDNRKLQLNTEGNAAKARIVATSGSVPGQVRLDIENASNSPKVSIITSGSSGLEGNVGIGTIEPSFALDITGSLDTTNNGIVRFGSNGGGDLVFNDNADGSNETAIKFGSNGRISGEGGEFNFQSFTNDFRFYTGSTVALNGPALTISGSNGNVGIGTTTPREALEVAGNIRAVGNIIAEQYIISSSVTHMTQSFSSGSTIFGDTNNDTHQFTGSILITGSSITSERTPLVITSDGEVQIADSDFITSTQTGSFITSTQTGSFIVNSQTSSFITTTQTGSFVTNSQTSSFITTTQTGSFLLNTTDTFEGLLTLSGTLNVNGNGHITASGNISSSGDISAKLFKGTPVIIESNASNDTSVEPGRVFVSGALKLKSNSALGDSNVALEYEIPTPAVTANAEANTTFASVLRCESGSNFSQGVVKAKGKMAKASAFTDAQTSYLNVDLSNTAAVCIPVFRCPSDGADTLEFTPTVTFTADSNTPTACILPTCRVALKGLSEPSAISFDDSKPYVINSPNFLQENAYGISSNGFFHSFMGNPKNNGYTIFTSINFGGATPIDSSGVVNYSLYNQGNTLRPIQTLFTLTVADIGGVNNLCFIVSNHTMYSFLNDLGSIVGDNGGTSVIQDGTLVDVEVIVPYKLSKF